MASKSIFLQKALHWLHHEGGEIPTEILCQAFRELDVCGCGSLHIDEVSDALQCCGGANVLALCGLVVRDITAEIRMSCDEMDIHQFVEFFRHLEEIDKYYNAPGVSYVSATQDWGFDFKGRRRLGKRRCRLDKVISDCALIQDQYEIIVFDDANDGAILSSPSAMKANGNYTITRTEGDVTITVIWNGSKKADQIMPVSEASRYLQTKQEYIKGVPEGKIVIANDNDGVALPALSDMKKRGKYTVTITNPWAAHRFWHETVDGAEALVDPAMDAERREYIARKAVQNMKGWVAGADARRMFQRRKKCAIFIQSVWRGNRCRKRIKEIKAVLAESQTKSLKATCFRLAEQIWDLREENESLRRQVEDYQDFCDDYSDYSYMDRESYTPLGDLAICDLGPLPPPLLPSPLAYDPLPYDSLVGNVGKEAPNGKSQISALKDKFLKWTGVRSAKHNLDDMESRLLQCQLDFDFYSDSDLSDAAKQVVQLDEQVADAKTKLEGENRKWFDKGGVRSARNRLTDLEDRVHALQNLLPLDVACQQLDAHESVTLNRVELVALFHQLDPGRWTNDDLERLFDAIDQNGKDQINLNEFMRPALGKE